MVINKLNAPSSISKSDIIYSLRCMVGYEIPLNQGCLALIPVNIPKWSILDPDYQISGRPVPSSCTRGKKFLRHSQNNRGVVSKNICSLSNLVTCISLSTASTSFNFAR
ncbi:unnamed protein product [Clavelina lepadiformis]|uniref:Hydantoinase B/oxoprolinase domain-containing protein n=1 Tax=Clavelina lepadiformis TaxID=159417 RepID=A0ABP0G6U9_CLALP